MQTTSMALKEITKEDANTREKRSPASQFGFNLGSPVSAAKKTFSSIGNIFSDNRANRHHNNDHEHDTTQYNTSGPYGNVRNTNRLLPIEFPSKSGIPNSMTYNGFQKEDKYVRPQENTSEVGKSTVPESNNRIKNLHQQLQTPENTGHYQSNADIDKQLLEYIFQNQQFNNDPAGTTVDNNINFVTETGEFETVSISIYKILVEPIYLLKTKVGDI